MNGGSEEIGRSIHHGGMPAYHDAMFAQNNFCGVAKMEAGHFSLICRRLGFSTLSGLEKSLPITWVQSTSNVETLLLVIHSVLNGGYQGIPDKSRLQAREGDKVAPDKTCVSVEVATLVSSPEPKGLASFVLQ
ncbi:hypothetical protein CDAR_448881 [Caerostris darwini]|uniref:Uncharacterized protein n=1 Tax=Caerostris darwini TaxID=1538125 RepID=A0AAV4WD35_9ARAC|nr:hypothetical protein CDAR_448881 [Caerostris darwini]